MTIKLWILSALIKREDGQKTVTSHQLGWRRCATREEAIGSFYEDTKKARSMFAVSDILCSEIPEESEDGLLSALAERAGWELSYGEMDGDLTECSWRVHRRHGGVNDREWLLLGTGETPAEALRSALETETRDRPAAASSSSAGRPRPVPEGQTPLDAEGSHRYLRIMQEGEKARDQGVGSPYDGQSLEHCLHAYGWVARDLRLALDTALSALVGRKKDDDLGK